MPDWLSQLVPWLPDWLWQIILWLAGILLGSGGILWFVRKKYEAGIKRNLDTHAQILSHNLEKNMLHAKAVAQSKHIIYPELFGLIRKYDGTIGPLMPNQRRFTFQEWSKDEFEELLISEDIKSGMINQILTAWVHKREEGVKEYYAYKRVQDLCKADESRIAANNYLLLKALYISKDVKEYAGSLIDEIKDLVDDYRYKDETRAGTRAKGSSETTDIIQGLFGKLESLMKAELGSDEPGKPEE